MTLIGSDQSAELALHSKVKFLFKYINSKKNVMFRFGGAKHYTWNETNRLHAMDFQCIFSCMKLDRAKTKLALVLRNNNNA